MCLQEQFEVSERRACRVVGQSRSTQRYEHQVPDDEPALVARMLELVRQWPRAGYRIIGALLREEGFRANHKRVYRLWRREGLKVPQHRKKRRRLGSSENGCVRRQAERPNQVWSYDFVFDTTSDGRTLKMLAVVDEFTRECLALRVARRLNSRDVIETVAELIVARGAPEHIRSDNGPEFVAKAVQRWLKQRTVKTLYIEPGAPWENAYVESFNARLRDELLSGEIFDHLLQAKVVVAEWQDRYNRRRPHGSLGYLTPAAFAEQWVQPASAPLRRAEPRANLGSTVALIAGGS